MPVILQIVCQKIDIMTTKKQPTTAAAIEGSATEKKVRKPAAKRTNTRRKTTSKAAEVATAEKQAVEENKPVAENQVIAENKAVDNEKKVRKPRAAKKHTAQPKVEPNVQSALELNTESTNELNIEPTVEQLSVNSVEEAPAVKPVETPVEQAIEVAVRPEVKHSSEVALPMEVKQPSEVAVTTEVKQPKSEQQPAQEARRPKTEPQPVVIPDLPNIEINSIVDLAQAPQRSIVLTDQQIQQLTLDELAERHAYLQRLLANVLDYDVVISDTNIWLELFIAGGHGDQRSNARLQFERQLEFISKLVKHRGCRFMMMGETYEEIDRFATMQDPTNHKEADFSDNVVCLNTAARLAKRLILSQQRENRLRIEGLGAESHHASFADPAIIRKVVELFADGKKVLLITNDASVAIRSIGLCDDLQRINCVSDEEWDDVFAPLRPMVFTFDDLKLLDNYTRQYHYIQMASGEPWMCQVTKREKATNVVPLDLWLDAFRPGDKHRGDNLFTDQEMQLLQKKEQQKQQNVNQSKQQPGGQQKQQSAGQPKQQNGNQPKQQNNRQKQQPKQQQKQASKQNTVDGPKAIEPKTAGEPKDVEFKAAEPVVDRNVVEIVEIQPAETATVEVAEEPKQRSRSRRKPSGRGRKSSGEKSAQTSAEN